MAPQHERSEPDTDGRRKLVDRALKREQYRQDSLIEVLHTAQEAYGFLDDELLRYVASRLKLPPSWVYGVATFYHFFSLKPRGRHTCIVCMGTACYVKRAAELTAEMNRRFGVLPGETTADGELSMMSARCLGSCGLAPVAVVDGHVLPTQTPESLVAQVQARIRAGEQPTDPADPAEPVEPAERMEVVGS